MLYPMRPLYPLVLPSTPKSYIVQMKYDGWALVVEEGRVWTRRGKEITHWKCFDNLDLCTEFPLHAELMSETGGGSHQVSRLKTGSVSPRIVVHDVMVENVPLEERLRLLRKIVPSSIYWEIAPTYEFSGWKGVNLFLEKAKLEGYEGLILKEKGSLYHIGKCDCVESPVWYKIKMKVC